MVVQGAIELAAEFGSLWAEGRASAFKEDHGHDASVLRVSIRGEPAETDAVFGAGAGLAEDLLFTEVHAQAAGGTVLYGAHHALGDFRNERSDIELALYLGLE